MGISVHPALPGMGENYLFEETARQAAAFAAEHPLSRVISLGIGDVTEPLPAVAAQALRTAAAEMASPLFRRGYGPAAGYRFLREAIACEYQRRDCGILPEEITVTCGAKEALGAVLALFDPAVPVWVCDPVYPAYRDCALSAGHPVELLPCREENSFLPQVEDCTRPGLVFLCSPNNPTGAVLTAEDWRHWVDFAQKSGSILIADSAYAAFITDHRLPHSVYEIAGSEHCAIEIGSFSKSAGFTGLRCGWIVIPQTLTADDIPLIPLWKRWLGCHCNGVSYPIQRAAEAVLSPTGKRQCEASLEHYRRNASRMRRYFAEVGIPCWGGIHAPYLLVKCPQGTGSWDVFRRLLEERGVLCTPGVGFGAQGEGYLRLTAFASESDTVEALRRLQGIL